MQDGIRILIADDKEHMRRVLVEHLKNKGFIPIEAENGQRAVELFPIIKPKIVIADVVMPKMGGLEVLESIKKIDKSAIVILMTGYGSEEVLIKALRQGANNFYRKPFEINELSDWIINLINQEESEQNFQSLFSPHIVSEEKHFCFPTAEANLIPIISQIGISFPHFFEEDDIMNLKIGMEEMLSNAIEHGNLGIGSEEKNTALEQGRFGELVAERLKMNNNAQKMVYVDYIADSEKIEIIIRDQGPGFAWQDIPPPSPQNLVQLNGRGIFLARVFYDEVIFNQKGNEVRLIKKRIK